VRRRRALGLRWRLLLALVLTSAVTLAVAAYALVGPLTERLRDSNIETLRQASLGARPGFERARRLREPERYLALQTAGLRLQGRANARVLVSDPLLDEFEFDTDIGAPTQQALLAALRSLRTRGTVVVVEDDQATIAIRLFKNPPGERTPGILVAQRQLTDVTAAVQQVRNALLAAAGVGLLGAVLLSLAISSTLLRRLERLRAAALRITAEGATAPPPPEDRVRDEVGDLARTLTRMQEALQREEASRRSFVSTASHELRTPLTMLQGTMELLEEDLRDEPVDLEDAQRQVASARRELLRLSSLAGELLDLSRLDAQVPLRSEPVELSEIARAVAAEFDLRAAECRIDLAIFATSEPPWAIGDPDAIARVLRILVDNALRHAPPDTTIEMTAGGHERGWASLEVADSGPGVLPQERERIFERFYRSPGASSQSGFGLGLAIGRGLAERMGGSLKLSSGDGAGARFVFTLPSSPSTPGAPLDHDGGLDRVGVLGKR